MDVFLSSALTVNVWVFLPGNQIHGFGCPAFEIGKTWIFFFNFEHCYYYYSFFFRSHVMS